MSKSSSKTTAQSIDSTIDYSRIEEIVERLLHAKLEPILNKNANKPSKIKDKLQEIKGKQVLNQQKYVDVFLEKGFDVDEEKPLGITSITKIFNDEFMDKQDKKEAGFDKINAQELKALIMESKWAEDNEIFKIVGKVVVFKIKQKSNCKWDKVPNDSDSEDNQESDQEEKSSKKKTSHKKKQNKKPLRTDDDDMDDDN